MATQPTEGSVPLWFHEYAIENERQHRELSMQIADMRGLIANVENRIIKWTVVQLIASIIAASSVATLVQQVLVD